MNIPNIPASLLDRASFETHPRRRSLIRMAIAIKRYSLGGDISSKENLRKTLLDKEVRKEKY